MKGLTRVIVLAACIGALNFIPVKGHCQDQSVNNPGLFEESGKNSTEENNSEAKQEENKSYNSPYHDKALFGDSTNVLFTTTAWQHIKDRNKNGHGMNTLMGGGGGPNDPGPDPDAPFDGGVTVLFLVALGYGYYLHRTNKYKLLPVSNNQ